MSYSKRYMICFLLILPILIGSIVKEVVLVAFPDNLFAESETVNTYILTSKDKQLTIAERTYNLDEDISATVTETVYRYDLKGSNSKDTDKIYMSKIQYISSDGNPKESISIIKDREDIINKRIVPITIINTLIMIVSMVTEIIILGAYRITNDPNAQIKFIQSLYIH